MITAAVIVFTLLAAMGYQACRLLYARQDKVFAGSALQEKVLLWVPIFAMFILYASYPRQLGLLIVLGIVYAVMYEAFLYSRSPIRLLVIAYAATIAVGLGSFVALPYVAEASFIAVCLALGFGSVMADVAAFFAGNTIGKHKLPRALNNSKSWEGVGGELLGALIGVALVKYCIVDVSLLLAVPIGLGAIAGDLANSYVKRAVGVKDWAQHLPGHGGYLDRVASLSGSAVAVLLAVYH